MSNNTFQKGASLRGMTHPSIQSLQQCNNGQCKQCKHYKQCSNSENSERSGSNVNSVNSELAVHSTVLPPSLMVFLVVQDSDIVIWLAWSQQRIKALRASETASWGSWPRRGAFKNTFYAEDKILGPICSSVWSIWVTRPMKIAAFCRRRVSKAAALNVLVTLSGTLVDVRNRKDGFDANAGDISLVRVIGLWTGTWGKWPCAPKLRFSLCISDPCDHICEPVTPSRSSGKKGKSLGADLPNPGCYKVQKVPGYIGL